MSNIPGVGSKAAGPVNGQTASKFVFGFLDETGSLGSRHDSYFALGILRASEPHRLQRQMRHLRERAHHAKEIKWSSKFTKLTVQQATIDEFFASEATLSVLVADNTIFASENLPHDRDANNARHLKTYERLACRLLQLSIRRGETMFLVADEYSGPRARLFEESIQHQVNKLLRRQAVAGVCRMRSSGVDLLQVTDLLLGAIVHEYKQQSGPQPDANGHKSDLVEYLKEKANTKSLLGDHQDERLQIINFHDFDFPNNSLR